MTSQMVTGALLGLWLGLVVGLVVGYLVTAPLVTAFRSMRRRRAFLRGERFRVDS
jgi:hypothetical protein